MPDCFIIMPISTPETHQQLYSGDPHHFQHVLEHLFIPAIEKAGLKAIPPSAKGSDLIHASVIHHLEKADLVLCDMSILNPNVFFELGIRTAVDKPVCVAKDDATLKVPFDTSILHYHTYSSKLELWNIEKQKEDLTTHIKSSLETSGKQNTLWKYFGLSSRATLDGQKQTPDDKFQLLTLQIEGLSRKFDEGQQVARAGQDELIADDRRGFRGLRDLRFVNGIHEILGTDSKFEVGFKDVDNQAIITLPQGFPLNGRTIERLHMLARKVGFDDCIIIEASKHE